MRPIQACKIAAAGLILLIATGCQPTVYLMPTPEALASGKHDPFAANKEHELDNQNYVAYATNRLPFGFKTDRTYLTLFDDDLRLGVARVRIGDEGASFDELRAVSTTREREGSIPLALENASELANIPTSDPSAALSAEARAFFDEINAALERSKDPDLILYVHGANNNFYRASAQASQIRHFSGQNSVVMLYAWPSAESFLKYAVDVNNARLSAPVFARLLELLAQHSNARNIDILAYSAGAQIVSPALAHLRKQHKGGDIRQLRKRLRLGEVYFAAPDVDFRGFLKDLASFVDVVSHVTVAINPDDTVLAFAAYHHGVSRAGRPDSTELTAEESQWVLDAARRWPFDVIWIDPDTLPGMSKGAHDFWYSHPWVSTDFLMQFLFQARPADRGLEFHEDPDKTKVWYFPADYPDKISPAIDRLKKISALR